MLKPNIQLFADENQAAQASQTSTQPQPIDEGKTYTADYVKTLREEAKNYRLRANSAEKSIRTAFGLKDDEEIGDISERLTTRENAALKAANDRLITAEIKTLEGYDHKLLSKVIDLSGVKVDEKGNVTGIKEAAEAAAKEFPAVKSTVKPSFVPPNPAAGNGTDNPNQMMNALIRGKR